MPKRIELTGQQFNRWIVVEFAYVDKHKEAHWLCRCQCGTQRNISSSALRYSQSKSCGCWAREITSKRSQGNQYGLKHGLQNTKIYRAWQMMHQRCYNPKNIRYGHYGDRGISVCPRWHHDNPKGFLNFLQDIQHPPTPMHSIDRINNDGNYEPSNCRWATSKQQSQNRRLQRNSNGTYGIIRAESPPSPN